MSSSLHTSSKYCMHDILEKREAIWRESPLLMLKKPSGGVGAGKRTKLSVKSIFSTSHSILATFSDVYPLTNFVLLS